MSYAEEIEAEFMVFEAYIEEAARQGIWITKDGTEIRVEDMTDRHLANTIAFLERKNTGDIDIYMPWISRLKAEQKRRNNIAKIH